LVQVIPLPNVKGLSLVKTSLHSWNEWFADELDAAYFDKILVMILATVTSLRHLLGWAVSVFRSRENLVLENLALRQQLLAWRAVSDFTFTEIAKVSQYSPHSASGDSHGCGFLFFGNSSAVHLAVTAHRLS
jgi:hypothetical protein